MGDTAIDDDTPGEARDFFVIGILAEQGVDSGKGGLELLKALRIREAGRGVGVVCEEEGGGKKPGE